MVKKFEKVKDELLDHEYDGIQELDNELPPWWLWLFYITIIWSVVYMVYYHVLGTGPSSAEEYQMELARAETMYQQPGGDAAASVEGQESAQKIVALTDAQSLEEGMTIFGKNCVPCHGTAGEGTIGPNLTDDYWIHGATMKDMVNTITNGIPAKGMISWAPVLEPDEIVKVASYIRSLHNTNPPNAKAPEGEKVDYSQLED
jgi:cytochrome c oxidase cbb3-type subunit 3